MNYVYLKVYLKIDYHFNGIKKRFLFRERDRGKLNGWPTEVKYIRLFICSNGMDGQILWIVLLFFARRRGRGGGTVLLQMKWKEKHRFCSSSDGNEMVVLPLFCVFRPRNIPGYSLSGWPLYWTATTPFDYLDIEMAHCGSAWIAILSQSIDSPLFYATYIFPFSPKLNVLNCIPNNRNASAIRVNITSIDRTSVSEVNVLKSMKNGKNERNNTKKSVAASKQQQKKIKRKKKPKMHTSQRTAKNQCNNKWNSVVCHYNRI